MSWKICYAKKGYFTILLVILSFLKLLLFSNSFSYWCQIGLKWKIIWWSFCNWAKESIFEQRNFTIYDKNRLCSEFFTWELIFGSQNVLKKPNHWSNQRCIKYSIKLSSMWEQLDNLSFSHLKIRAIFKRTSLKLLIFFSFYSKITKTSY